MQLTTIPSHITKVSNETLSHTRSFSSEKEKGRVAGRGNGIRVGGGAVLGTGDNRPMGETSAARVMGSYCRPTNSSVEETHIAHGEGEMQVVGGGRTPRAVVREITGLIGDPQR